MFRITSHRVFAALLLTATLLFGATAAEAHDRHGSDRVVRGAVAGAAVGVITQILRGHTEGNQVLKGAVVGSVLGAAVGAYNDSERGYNRYDYRHRAGYDQYQYDPYWDSRRNQGDDDYYDYNYNDDYDYNDAPYYRQDRESRTHRHNGRCRH
jgi:uncharacterized protein YcfJ